jgi:hypothetical protein
MHSLPALNACDEINYLQEVGCGGMTGWSWLRIGTGDGNEPSGYIKCREFLG